MEKGFVVASMLMMAGGLHLTYVANADKGKVLFERSTLGGGTSGINCMTCHDGGKGLGSDLFERKKFTTMGTEKNNLPDVINVCIQQSLGGGALDPQSGEMKDLIAYIKTLVKQAAKK